MNRREWFQASGGIGAGLLFARFGHIPALAAASQACSWEVGVKKLQLRHTWTTTMSSSQFRDTIHVRVTSDGVTGVGEGAPIVRYHENAEEGAKAIAGIIGILEGANLWQYEKLMERISHDLSGQFAAKA